MRLSLTSNSRCFDVCFLHLILLLEAALCLKPLCPELHTSSCHNWTISESRAECALLSPPCPVLQFGLQRPRDTSSLQPWSPPSRLRVWGCPVPGR